MAGKNEISQNVAALSDWYSRIKRDLPWRKSHDPYSIWISEVMLQQTTVKVVVTYYERFLSKLPTVGSLASAPEEEVLKLWSGLGYYSRARNLKRGAEFIVKDFGGNFPTDRALLERVPGIGPYTAGAILSIAFNSKEAIVDGNVKRVFARYYGIQKSVDSPEANEKLWDLSREWVTEAREPRVFNQALMELGALICTKASPQCETCTLKRGCVAFRKGWQNRLPMKKKRTAPLERFFLVFLHERDGKIFFRKNQTGWWKDLWDFPREVYDSRDDFERALKKSGGEILDSVYHVVTQHKILATPVRITRAPRQRTGQWLPPSKTNLPLSSLSKKILASL